MKRLWMKKAREEAGYSMKQAAEKLDISESYYCEIENGNRQKSLDLSFAMRISSVFGLPVKDILDNEYQSA